MPEPTTIVTVLIGFVLILVALRDILHTLLVPHGRGAVSGRVMRIVWRILARLARGRPAGLAFAGPRVMLAVVTVWCALIVTGWALVYISFLPDGFVTTPGVPEEAQQGFRTALYYSMITLSTLGFGELAPTAFAMRFASATQGLVGFVLLTAVISWLLGVFPVLSRQRALSQHVDLLRQHEDATGQPFIESDMDAVTALFADLTERVITAESDLSHTPVSYYFAEAEGRASVPLAIGFLLHQAELAQRADAPPRLQLQGELLERAIAKLATTVSTTFLARSHDTPDAILRAWAEDHNRGADVGVLARESPGRGQRVKLKK